MARIFIDVNMFSEAWFSSIVAELIENDKVIFSYSNSKLFSREFAKTRKALEFYKLVGEKTNSSGVRRRLDIDAGEIENKANFLLGQSCFINSSDCDDPHIFSLVYLKPTKFIFSMDARMARCRDHINKSLDSRYCDFIVISDASVYSMHKHRILG